MKSATILPFKPDAPIIGAHADHERAQFLRQQSRYSATLDPSPAPFKRSVLRNLIGELIARIAA